MLKVWFGRLNLFFAKEVSWLWFVVAVTLFLTAMNFNAFAFCFKHGESDFVEALSFVAIGFLLLLFCCALLFVPFLTKFLAILFVLLTAVCSYFIAKFGVFIDASMVENTFKTDTKEAFELLNFGFVLWVAFLGVLPSLVILKVKLRYHNWQRHLLQKAALLLLSLALLAAVAVPQLEMLIPFFRHYKQVEYLFLPYAPIKSANKHLRSFYKKSKTIATIAPNASLEKCSERELQNVYDNTILYADFVLSELIECLQTRQNATLLYISDHGESLGEDGLYLHGVPYAIAPEVQTSVPILLFSHDQALLRAAKTHKNHSHDYIFHSILSYFGVKTEIYNV